MMLNTHIFKLYRIWTVLLVFLLGNPTIEARKVACVCEKYGLQSGFCSPVKQSSNKEVVVVHEGQSNYKNWQWESITAVLSTSDAYNDELMCIAHSKNKYYGTIEKVPRATNKSDPVIQNYTDKLHKKFADVNFIVDLIAFDLLDLLGDCQISDTEAADNVIELLIFLIAGIKTEVGGSDLQVFCVVPYKPPCFQQDCKYFTSKLLSKHCDRVITSPESYITYCDHNCKARATVPETKLTVGVDEYLTSGVLETNMLIGIPWHGYDYKCSNYIKKGVNQQDICEVNQVNGSNICDFGPSSRIKLTLADLTKNYNDYIKVNNYQNETHQVWFEAADSLRNKYIFVKLMGIRGVVIWTADDLSNAGPGIESEDNGVMWAWVKHELYVSESIAVHDISIAGKMAVVGVGCFVVGAAIGLLVACVVNRSRGIKRRKPFSEDEEDIDAYHDDDNVL
ncbi:hypothetical protein KUTeg_023289 [Tegillarca granosa]|uniref:GH18 domain-containing protein n=1 Tax=Tegillarca granosa TaxID=220873 RepID=A0ABQ9E1L0_TEGGR|nr:hypothetical protein KUTeg_023289 [Tegillarca granosa]